MTDVQLRSFILAVQMGSFTQAARSSYITVPSFSQQIRLLEGELGFSLFNRSPQGVRLTRAGESFYATTHEILRALDEGRKRAQALAGPARPMIRISYNSMEPLPTFLSNISLLFNERHPDIDLVFYASDYRVWLEDVRAAKSDLCFFMPPDKEVSAGLSFVELYQDRWFCCLSPHDPLIKKSVIEIEDLRGKTLFIDGAYNEAKAYGGLFNREDLGFVLREESFSVSQVMRAALDKGVIPTPEGYLSSCCPPLFAVPLNWPLFRQGLVYREGSYDDIREFVEVARLYFQGR
ncbi:MAG: LysR family transcriptional regulator [Coriobacteriales bacterium]|jgi:DNA-binding transcriptional LysR family regulator|nr:LysR family transcriptional regulator [Coriobacteriales bacterium]